MKIRYHNNTLHLNLDNKVDYSICFAYGEILNATESFNFSLLNINFRDTRFVTLPGAMYLFLIAERVSGYKASKGQEVRILISEVSENVEQTLMNFGFLSILKTTTPFIIPSTLENESNQRIQYWRKVTKEGYADVNSLYLPMMKIPNQEGDNFESELGYFINKFNNYFNTLANSALGQYLPYKHNPDIRKDFIAVIVEATKNVWDHSESWGSTGMYSSKSNKTTICLFDLGVGFINSYMKRKGSFERTVKNDMEILGWLFKRGNTSNEDSNYGFGLHQIAEYVVMTSGLLMIKTDKYLMTYDKSHHLKVATSSYFPGSQLMIHF